MDKLQKFNDKILKMNNKVFKFDPPVYNVNILSSEHGSISASPVSGYPGTTVTLSNTPDSGYNFINYEVNGANLYDGNKFDLFKSDVTVQGNFSAYKDRYEYTIFETSNGLGVSSGTCNSNINSYDQIGILLVNISRSVGGGEWLWFDKDGISASSGSHYIKYNTNDGVYFQTFQLVFNWNGATFSISHPNSNGWDLYTRMSDNTRMYANNPGDMNNSVAQIVGVKYQ